jgi:hypothetical protein
MAPAVPVVHEPEELGVSTDASYIGLPDVPAERWQDQARLHVLAAAIDTDGLPDGRPRVGP